MTIPIIRKRAKRPKTRTGCFTCKARHVKCDEEKPTCRQCHNSARTCGGYAVAKEKSVVGIQKYCLLQPRPLTMNKALIPAVVSPNLSPMERKALDFFVQRTAHGVPGSSWFLPWHKILLETTIRMCFHEPAITYISTALGSIHLAYCSIDQSSASIEAYETLAEHQCAKAMSALRKYISAIPSEYSDTHTEVLLLVSLLFFYFERWRARDHAASIHLRSGLQILYEQRGDRPAITDGFYGKRQIVMEVEPRSSLSLLSQAFVRLDGDLVVTKGVPYLSPTVNKPLPGSFLSMDEAMVHLDALSASVSAITDDLFNMAKAGLEKRNLTDGMGATTSTCIIGAVSRAMDFGTMPQLLSRMQETRDELCRWLDASASVPFESEQECAHLLTGIRFFTLWYETISWREPCEMFNDALEDQFSHILAQCERYMTLNQLGNLERFPAPATSRSADSVCPVSSLGTSLVTCICGIAFKCRKSSIRRRCVKLLASVDLQGIFDNFYLISFVQAIIDWEETQARASMGIEDGQDLESYQVPSEVRFLDVDMDREVVASDPEFYKADSGSFIYAVYGSDGNVEVHTQAFQVQRPAFSTPTSFSAANRLSSRYENSVSASYEPLIQV